MVSIVPDGDDSLLVPGLAHMQGGDHGTACAGMATARANKIGGVGVAFDATLHLVACLEDQVGTQLTLARALAFAANPTTEGAQAAGADVVACSLVRVPQPFGSSRMCFPMPSTS